MSRGKLDLDPVVVRKARSLARQAGRPIVNLAKQHTTVSVERATLRLAGLQGADPDGIPWVNRLLDATRGDVGLEHGIALPVWDALVRGEADDLATLAQKAAVGSVRFRVPEGRDLTRARAAATKQVGAGLRRVDARRRERERLVKRYGDPDHQPWIYLIVATGDIYEDMPQAQQAAREGADIIAVIRSTGQSLLDYVPEGATREGFAGTYATQENFRLMRAALDESSKELGRYVRLTNYASGLCMPEIAALAGLERLDMMLNDSMYGILFRDINPIRTFVDQRFSRQVHARAGIIINTGEDNYLTTADAIEASHTVTVSQLLNEFFAKEAGLEDWQLGLGHAFEINPEVPDSFRMELAHALLARELFPEGAAEVDATDPAHDRRRVPRLPARRVLQPGRGDDRPEHPAGRDDDRGGRDALALRPGPGPAERPVRHGRRGPAGGGLPPEPGRVHRPARPAGALREHRAARADHRPRGQARAAGGDRRRHLRPDEAPRGRRPRPRRGGEEGSRLLQPGDRPPGGEVSDSHIIRPYGDTTGDGMVQLSFTLPMPNSKIAEGAAAQLAAKMGIDPALVVHAKAMGPDFTFFVVYGRVHHLVDVSQVTVVERDYPLLTPKEVNAAIKRGLRRRLTVVGGCIGTDAHTVGIDAILNIKGFAGEKGLEYYRELKVVNLGAQVSVPQLVARAREEKADAILVSQVVTQRDAHLANTKEMSAAFRESYPSDRRPLLIVGGPRFDEKMAAELGVDRVFSRGTTPGEVASYLTHQLVTRRTGKVSA